jgi:hypothetical protein
MLAALRLASTNLLLPTAHQLIRTSSTENDLARFTPQRIAWASAWLAAGMAMGQGAQAQQHVGSGTAVASAPATPPTQRAAERVRPAPVKGKVLADPAAVALRPAAALPAVSTAKQVPVPKGFSETPVAEPGVVQVSTTEPANKAPAVSASHAASQAMVGPAGTQARHEPLSEPKRAPQLGSKRAHQHDAAAPAGKARRPTPTAVPAAAEHPQRQHLDRTKGKKKPGKTVGHPKDQKRAGQPHVKHADPEPLALAPRKRSMPTRAATREPAHPAQPGHAAAGHQSPHGAAKKASAPLPDQVSGKKNAKPTAKAHAKTAHRSAGAATVKAHAAKSGDKAQAKSGGKSNAKVSAMAPAHATAVHTRATHPTAPR